MWPNGVKEKNIRIQDKIMQWVKALAAKLRDLS